MKEKAFKVGDKVKLSKQQYEKETQCLKDALKNKGFNFTNTYEVSKIIDHYDTFVIELKEFEYDNFFIRFFELASKKSVGFIIE